MKTIRAKDLIKENIIIETNNERLKIEKLDITRRGSIMIWTGVDGCTMKFYNPNDVLVIE